MERLNSLRPPATVHGPRPTVYGPTGTRFSLSPSGPQLHSSSQKDLREHPFVTEDGDRRPETGDRGL